MRPGIDPPLAFGMCGETGGGGFRMPMSMIHQAVPFCVRCPLTRSLSLALVICCCSQTHRKPPPPQKKEEKVDRGKPIIGQAFSMLGLNSWLIEPEVEGTGGRVCGDVGGIKPRLCATMLGARARLSRIHSVGSFSRPPSPSLHQRLYGALNKLRSI